MSRFKRHWCSFCGIHADAAPGGLFADGLYGPLTTVGSEARPGICAACAERARAWFSRPSATVISIKTVRGGSPDPAARSEDIE